MTHSVIVREVLRELMGRARPAVKSDLQRLLQAAGLPDRTSAARPGKRRVNHTQGVRLSEWAPYGHST